MAMAEGKIGEAKETAAGRGTGDPGKMLTGGGTHAQRAGRTGVIAIEGETKSPAGNKGGADPIAKVTIHQHSADYDELEDERDTRRNEARTETRKTRGGGGRSRGGNTGERQQTQAQTQHNYKDEHMTRDPKSEK